MRQRYPVYGSRLVWLVLAVAIGLVLGYRSIAAQGLPPGDGQIGCGGGETTAARGTWDDSALSCVGLPTDCSLPKM